MTKTPTPNPIGPPSRDTIAEAYQEGGCDICFGPPDVGADRAVGGYDFADHDPEDLHWLADGTSHSSPDARAVKPAGPTKAISTAGRARPYPRPGSSPPRWMTGVRSRETDPHLRASDAGRERP